MRAATLNLFLVVLLAFAATRDGLAQRQSHVRIFRSAGSYAASVSFTPNGEVVSRSGDTPQVTLLDGFSRSDIRIPEESHHRVFQSRSGQLWSISQEGLLLHHANQWTPHPVPEIRAELLNSVRPLRQISIVPAEVNRVLVLLPDRLVAYEASTRTLRLLKNARDTKLGQFTEMQEGLDESVWIAGLHGVARISGPLRRIGADSEWTEYPLSRTNSVNNLQRPFESTAGNVTITANPLNSEARYIVSLGNRGWTEFLVPDEKIRQAWRAWDNTVWGFSFNSLFRYRSGPPEVFSKEPAYGRQYDAAVEPSGAFWIAASEGLVRYAPFLWHATPEFEDMQSAVHALLFEPGAETNLFLSVPEGLIYATPRTTRLFPWPEELETTGAPRGKLFALPNKSVLIGTPGHPFIFNSDEARFIRVAAASGTNLHFLGQTGTGAVVAQFERPNDELDLRVFDGRTFTRIELPPINENLGELSFYEEMPAGDAWLGGASGLLHIRTNRTAEVYGPNQGLGERVFTVAAAGEGRIWCGTESRVCEWRGRFWQTILNTPDRVHAIIRTPDGVWVGTAGAVYRLLGDSWISYGANEGLSSLPIFTLRKNSANELWVGTSRGIAVYHAHADPDPPRTIAPALIEPSQPSIGEPTVISFQGQDKWDYTAPHDLLFSYKLDETPWTPFSNITTRVFPKLSSGSHSLQVLAMDRNGNKAPAPEQITFSVIVPWFKDPRLLVVSIFALCLTVILAGLAVNKHWQLKRSYAEVEKIVAQRTHELESANRELLHSQKMRAIGTMAAGIAHDFNNILSIIKGSAQIIEDHTDDTDKIKTRVNRIQTVVEQGTTIVKALLGLGRMSDTDLSPCDLGALLHETQKLLSDRFSDSVKIHVEVDSNLPSTLCAHEVLQQMLLNLILNAVDAIGGEGVVLLSAHQTMTLPGDMILEPSTSPSFITLSVVDEGCGIDPESLPRIFEPFFTTKAFSSRRGTGLGLSMVYELAKGFGYGLRVTTKPGEGSSFSIIIPISPTPSSERTPPSSTHPTEQRPLPGTARTPGANG